MGIKYQKFNCCLQYNPVEWCNYIEDITLWRSRFRHRATNRKVAGSIPDGVIEMFPWHNPSGRAMALGLTQPLTEMSIRNISWGGRGAAVRRADNLTTFMCRLSCSLGTSTSWNPQGLFRPVMGLPYRYVEDICISELWSKWANMIQSAQYIIQ